MIARTAVAAAAVLASLLALAAAPTSSALERCADAAHGYSHTLRGQLDRMHDAAQDYAEADTVAAADRAATTYHAAADGYAATAAAAADLPCDTGQ